VHPPHDRPIAVAARRPRGVLVRLALPKLTAFAVLIGLVGWGTLATLGDFWRHECRNWFSVDGKDSVDDAPIELSNTHACVRAAAMPGGDAAAEHLLDQLDDHPYRDGRALRRLVGLSSIVEGCSGEVKRLMAHGRFEAAADRARRCGLARDRHMALLAQGRFDEAAAIRVPAGGDEPALPGGATLIAAGRWTEAAAEVEARAAAPTRRPYDPDSAEEAAARVLRDRCLGQLLRHHGGDRAAAGRLRALAAGPGGAACAGPLSEIALPEERRHILVTAQFEARIELLRWAAGAADDVPEASSAEEVLARADDTGPSRSLHLAWVAAQARLALAGDAPALRRASVLRWITVGHVLDGDPAAAAVTAREAVAQSALAPPRSEGMRDVAHLAAAVGLHTPSTAIEFDLARAPAGYEAEHAATVLGLWRFMFGSLLLRRGDSIDAARFTVPGEVVVELDLARDGDGRSLASELGPGGSWLDSLVMAVLPRVTSGREEIARQLVWSAPEGIVRLGHQFPWSLAGRAATRRDVLRMAGATDEAARWDAIYRRFDEAFEDRRRLMALLLWEE
jgi:hypothetical protein